MLEEVIQTKAEEFYQLRNLEKHKGDVVQALHELWEKTQEFCKESHHHNRQGFLLNYCHIQGVTICEECYKTMFELHKKYHKELLLRGWHT